MNERNTAVEKLKEQSLKSPFQEGRPEVGTNNAEINVAPVSNLQDQVQTKILEVPGQTQSETIKGKEATQNVIPISSGFQVDPSSKVGGIVAAKAAGEPINE
jgi:hypothetical protein